MSKIEWTDETWNVTTGCTRVSEGCDNCYAVQMSKRLANIDHTKEKYGGLVNEGKDHFNGKIKTHPEALEEAFDIPDGKKVFVNSMSDLFHPDVSFEFIDKVFAVMALNSDNIFQVLTKRPERMAEYLTGRKDASTKAKVMTQLDSLGDKHEDYFEKSAKIASQIPSQEYLLLDNVWLGTSVENQKAADERIPHLLNCPAAVRFLSCEPLLGPVDLEPFMYEVSNLAVAAVAERKNCTIGEALDMVKDEYPDEVSLLNEIHWVIAGGESGPDARPMHPDWVRTIRNQCQEADIPFFFKQWGAWKPLTTKEVVGRSEFSKTPNGRNGTPKGIKFIEGVHDYYFERVGKKKAGRQLDGTEWHQFPEDKQ